MNLERRANLNLDFVPRKSASGFSDQVPCFEALGPAGTLEHNYIGVVENFQDRAGGAA